MTTGTNRRLRAALIAMGLLATVTWSVAEPGAAAASAPASGASGSAGGVRDICAIRPHVCRALRRANKALIDAARATDRVNTICTSAIHMPACGTTPPQPYLSKESPYGNPAEVLEGRKLLDWYLKDIITCEALCRPGQDPQGCLPACKPSTPSPSVPNAASQPASGASAPSP